MAYNIHYESIRAYNLLGRSLDNVEEKFAPKMIFYKGTMEIPIPCPRVSIIGSRNASERGLLESYQKDNIKIDFSICMHIP